MCAKCKVSSLLGSLSCKIQQNKQMKFKLKNKFDHAKKPLPTVEYDYITI